jgi:hypothetical protein
VQSNRIQGFISGKDFSVKQCYFHFKKLIIF